MRFLHSPKGLSPSGSAAALVGPLVPLVAGVIYAGARWPELFRSDSASSLLETFGWLWLGIGVVFWLATLLHFLPRWTRGELITTGPFALCRHPLYALVPYFILPAVGLISDNRGFFVLALLSIPLALRAGAREEAELQKLFGNAWVAYAARTRPLLPLPANRTLRTCARVAWGVALALVLYAGVMPRG